MSEQEGKLVMSPSRITADIAEKALISGDLAKLSPRERLMYYRRVCDTIGLNPMTRPFEFITLNNKMVMYARKDATDQLRRIHGVSVTKLTRERMEDVYVVTATVMDRDGRLDEAVGAVSIIGLKGDNLANAMMKAETKAKRRATLSIVGLGWLDETEADSIPGAQIHELAAGDAARDETKKE